MSRKYTCNIIKLVDTGDRGGCFSKSELEKICTARCQPQIEYRTHGGALNAIRRIFITHTNNISVAKMSGNENGAHNPV